MTIDTPVARFLLLLGLGFFFGLAFEEFYASAKQTRPGGVRTFPMLAMVGALLYRLDPVRLLPLSVGLLVLGGWLALYYRSHLAADDVEGQPNVGLMVPLCSVLAYLIGPVALAEPPWVAVGVTVAGVLLLTARERLHGFARHIEGVEIITAGKFLVLTGLILPLLPDQPLTSLSDITPHQVWLAVLAVCTVSYASYLLQRYVAPAGAGLWVALLGGFYSSTATTVVLARHARAEPSALRQAQTGIILATSVMFLRLLIIIAVFSRPLAAGLAPALLGLSAAGLAMAGAWYWITRAGAGGSGSVGASSNPLELGAAFVFAVLFVLISLLSSWARSQVRGDRHLPAGGDRRRVRHRSVRAEPRRPCDGGHAGRRRGDCHSDRGLVEQCAEGRLHRGLRRRARRPGAGCGAWVAGGGGDRGGGLAGGSGIRA